jgi:glutaconate CoA-transferase subunit B
MSGYDEVVLDFLVRAAREFTRGGWVFTGFHWPVLAGQLAHQLPEAPGAQPFAQVFEAGATTHAAGRLVPTSTTDYPAYANALGFEGDSAAMLLGLAHRYDRVLLDASNLDVRGRVNSSLIGPSERPKVRLPGGGGAPDVAAAARELVWLSGGPGLDRLQSAVEHVTAAPGRRTLVRAHTRWGIVRLGDDPEVEELAEVAGVDDFTRHLNRLGVAAGTPAVRTPVSGGERSAAASVLDEARARGYRVARQSLIADGGR